MPNNEDYTRLSEAIDAATHTYKPMSGRSEIVEYYQDTYGPNWRSHITDKIEELTGGKRKSIEREFQKKTGTNKYRYESSKITKKTRERYEQLGKTLPLEKVPKNVQGKPATVHFQGTVWISKKPYYKDFTKGLSEYQTSMMLEGNIESIVEAYGIAANNIEDIQLDGINITFDD